MPAPEAFDQPSIERGLSQIEFGVIVSEPGLADIIGGDAAIERLSVIAQLGGQCGMAVRRYGGRQQAAVVDEDRRLQREGIDLAAPFPPVGCGQPGSLGAAIICKFYEMVGGD
jgi:hypothetical protein